MKHRQAAVVDEPLALGEHVVRLGREAGDQIGAEDDVGAQPARFFAEADRIRPQVAPPHAFQDHVGSGLQRQMQVRHQPFLHGHRAHQVGIGLYLVDRGKSQPGEAVDLPQEPQHEAAERHAGDEIRAI